MPKFLISKNTIDKSGSRTVFFIVLVATLIATTIVGKIIFKRFD